MDKNHAFQRAILISSEFCSPVTMFSRSIMGIQKREWCYRLDSPDPIMNAARERMLLWKGWRRETAFNKGIDVETNPTVDGFIQLIKNWKLHRTDALDKLDKTTRRRRLSIVIWENTPAGDAVRELAMGRRANWTLEEVTELYRRARQDKRTVGKWVSDGAQSFDTCLESISND